MEHHMLPARCVRTPRGGGEPIMRLHCGTCDARFEGPRSSALHWMQRHLAAAMTVPVGCRNAVVAAVYGARKGVWQ